MRLVNCLATWLTSVRKERTSSGVREFKSLSPKSAVNFKRTDLEVLIVFFLNEDCDTPASNGCLQKLS